MESDSINQSRDQLETNARARRDLWLLIPVVAAPSIGTLSALWFWPGPVGSAVYAGCKLVLYGLPFLLLLKMSRSQRPCFRTDLRGVTGGLFSGTVIGSFILGLWFIVLADKTDTGPLLAVITENGLGAPVKFWLFAAWLCIGNSLLEEFVFRWFVDGRLRNLGLQTTWILPVSAAIFTLHHIFVLGAYFGPTLTIVGASGVFIGGVLWSILHLRSSSLTPGWISHALVDLAIVVVGASMMAPTT
ncbi:MAG: hypothetical protein CMJ33_02545 [Phycisphaerae bacterium]|nr:hypothetical protein [Phycisphaerae bacterium]